MNIQVKITSPRSANTFAFVGLSIPDEMGACTIKTQIIDMAKGGLRTCPEVDDLLLLAVVVYALDRRVSRWSASSDNWTRSFSFTLPVDRPALWQEIKPVVDECLSFLSGDEWDVRYEKRKTDLLRLARKRNFQPVENIKAVSLFSGGLDSLVGVIDWLEQNPDAAITLVGHHDPRISGIFSDQRGVLTILQDEYPGRLESIFTGIGPDSGKETSSRSRSFLFIAQGLYAAASYSEATPLLIPENGTMALNAPLTPSRYGSCSTRTVHPHYLSLLRQITRHLGIHNSFVNPLEMKTKGECLTECLNRNNLISAIPYSASCGKRGRKQYWVHRNAKQCGICVPCIYRRAALHKLGQDNESYGYDFCKGEVDIHSSHQSSTDFLTYLAFLYRHPSQHEISKLLIRNGKIDLIRLPAYASVVERASNEVRELLWDKASGEIQRQAGIT
jgi:hypothetical protein